MSNIVLEKNHHVLGNLVWTNNTNKTYVDEDDPWSVVLTVVAFTICSTTNRLKYYSPVQLLFSCDVVFPIKYTVD